MKYLSLFSGIGGFELGIQQAYETRNNNRHATVEQSKEKGLQQGKDKPMRSGELGDGGWTSPLCIGYSEIDKYAIQVYQHHFPEHKNYGDATKINPKELSDFDLLCGGFPCQAFSIAGKRKGFADTRGTLFFDIARIVREKQPRLLLLENVKGLLSHEKGKTFAIILSTLDELGYDIQWQVLNAKDFGVPQNRERVFIVGHLRGKSRPEVFPIGQSSEIFSKKDRGKQKNGERICSTLDTRYGSLRNAGETYLKIAGTLEGGGWEKRHEQIRRVHSPDGLAPTTPTGTGGGVMTKITDNSKIRRLTPLECERLMGLPDNWTRTGTEGEISDTQRYKMCGNGVVVNVVKEIMLKII